MPTLRKRDRSNNGLEYNFLSNISDENIRENLKNVGEQVLSANLKAEASSEFILNPSEIAGRLYDDLSIGHYRIAETNIIAQNTFSQIGTSQISTSEVSTSQIRTGKIDTSQISVTEITPSNLTRQKGFTQVGTTEIDVIHDSDSKLDSFEVGITEVDLEHIKIPQTNITQINSAEIPFTSSIPSQQFFSVHNSTPEITNVLNNSATNIWSDLLHLSTQLDIDFQITDLPSGQLAEATITGFDDSGVPNAGIIENDRDANGVGWFIDETPLDNSEFSVVGDKADKQAEGETYLLAAAESEADGKYDLLDLLFFTN